jgi:prolipoprotein diacylglyceryltransferase
LWCLFVALVLVLAQRWLKLKNGQVFGLYVLMYCIGRAWVEMLRIDTANHILGLRLNVFTAVLVGIGALVWLIRSRRLSKSTQNG